MPDLLDWAPLPEADKLAGPNQRTSKTVDKMTLPCQPMLRLLIDNITLHLLVVHRLRLYLLTTLRTPHGGKSCGAQTIVIALPHANHVHGADFLVVHHVRDDLEPAGHGRASLNQADFRGVRLVKNGRADQDRSPASKVNATESRIRRPMIRSPYNWFLRPRCRDERARGTNARMCRQNSRTGAYSPSIHNITGSP